MPETGQRPRHAGLRRPLAGSFGEREEWLPVAGWLAAGWLAAQTQAARQTSGARAAAGWFVGTAVWLWPAPTTLSELRATTSNILHLDLVGVCTY